MTIKQLYRVTYEVEMICYADSERDAEKVAEECIDEIDLKYEGSFSAYGPIKKIRDLSRDEQQSLPYRNDDGEDEQTCEEILNDEDRKEALKQAALEKNTLPLPGIK